MRLQDLVGSDLTLAPAAAGIDIVGIAADSRAVRPGFVFAALRGAKADGATFIDAALRGGAAAILLDEATELPMTPAVPVLRSADPRRAFALAAARLKPLQPEKIVAVTGTSGKTSVAEFSRQIFEAAGHAAASIGTLGVVSRKGAVYGSLTTPDPVELHTTLDRLARDGVTHAALEASSHGLDQRRLDGVRIQAAGFTNLGRDHMDYHPTTADYLAAKLRLFEVLLPSDGAAVIDADGLVSDAVISAAERRGQRLLRTGRKGREMKLLGTTPDGFAQALRLEVLGRAYSTRLPLVGAFQASNALVAAGLAIGVGVTAEEAVAALEDLKGVPGRLERAGVTKNGALVFVDYAHKPEAIQNALAALRPFTQGRLVIVFGAGGDRDLGKRPLMARAASLAADIVIVTDDNPRTENPAAIRRAVLEGAENAIEIPDRRTAIRHAIAILQRGDILCVAGKGHETGQIVGTEVLPFSDHAVIAEALREQSAA